MNAPRLSNTTKITENDMPTIEMLKLIQEMARYIEALEARITALEP
jgi:hypothetical protein